MHRVAWVLLLVLPAFAPPGLGTHVPNSVSVVEVPDLGSGAQVLCVGSFYSQTPMQLAPTCELTCFSDWNCAIFFKDDDYLGDYPFAITYTDAHTQEPVHLTATNHSDDRGVYVCVNVFDLEGYHFVFEPEPLGLGKVGHAYGVEDEGQFCFY